MVFWEIVRLLLGGKEEEVEEKKKKLGLTELEAAKYDIDREIRKVEELLPKARKIIEEKIKEEPENKVLKKIYEISLKETIRDKFFPRQFY